MDETPDPTCWLHPSAEVGPSPIAGVGLFAIARISAGTPVSRLGGRLVDERELHELLEMASRQASYLDTIVVADGRHLVLTPDTANGKGNHSCDPNLWWTGPYTLTARRDIAAGEELTNDYATSTASRDFAMPCSCGGVECRRLVTGNDWRLASLQRRYGDHWVPALLRLIRHDGA